VRRQVAANGGRLVFLTNPPTAPNPLRGIPAGDAAKFAHLNDLYAKFAAQHPDDVTVVDLGELVCPGGASNGPCPVTQDGVTLRPKDGGHYEADGAAWVAPRLMPKIYDALRALAAGKGASTTTTTAR
jgi:lysophospholipase L1-like esterase